MKQSKLLKSIFLALLLSASALTASAYDFMVDDLAYNFNNDGTSVTVTSTVQSPWNGGNYNGLTTANIPSSVTYNGATYSVTSIGGETFLNCESLTSVTIPNSVTSIGGSAFYNCSGLTSVTIPNSVTSIGGWAFEACIGLTSVTIPNSVTSIGECAFCGCSGLTSVTIPNSVTSIGDETFAFCRGLTSVTIPNSVTYIGSFAFDGCSSLTSITSLIEDPSSVGLGGGVFEGVNAQQCILFVPQGKIQDYRNADQWNAFRHITDTHDFSGYITFADSEVERICVDNWDVNGDGFLSYEEADLVTSISEYCFYGSNITSFNELEYFHNLTSIGDCAFSECYDLASITIPNSVTSIGNYSFDNCSDLTSISIGNSVTSIGNGAFEYCSGLTSVTIGNSVTSIGYEVFADCSSLTSITIGNSVTAIGNGVFIGCISLESIVVEAGNTTFDSRNNCNAIIETASNTIIAGCKNTIIPNSVKSIGDNAFKYCTNLTSVTIPNSVTSISWGAFSGCSGLTSITIPNSVTSISNSAFAGCGGLTNLTLTGTGAWNQRLSFSSQIKTLIIGSGITSLGGFNFNPNVVNCYAEVPPTCSSSTFASYNGVLHVPASSMADYFIADYWQNFTNLNNDITEKVTLNQSSAALIQHEELQLTATTTPNGSPIIWSSTNQNVATVDNSGKVTATGQGECYIYATFATNPAVYASCQITASYPEITSLTLSETELVLNQISETFTLAAITTPANSGPKPTWTSSDEAVATVDANGLVTAINLGECDITATVLNQSATCHVTVTSAIIITLDMASATIAPNEILTLTPSFNPVETDIVTTSSDANVAFVRVITQNGFKKVQVLGLAEGTATITVSSVDGKAIPATCVVTVSNAPDVIMGDANGDGTVNVSDYVYVANYILEQNPEPFVFAAADIDGNGEINVSDLVLVANIALTYEDPNTLNAPAPKATLNADIDMNATLHKNADGTTSITFDLNNSMDLTALQMDISLPQGMAVTSATLTDRATRSHQAEVAQLSNGNYRLLAASSTSKAFKGNEGALLTLTLSGEPQGTVTLGGIKLASPDGQCFTVNDMLLAPIVTGIDDITAQARIYGEAGSIVIESPVNGTAQLVLPNGMSRTVKVKAGRNIYPAPATGLVIVRAGEKAVKLIF